MTNEASGDVSVIELATGTLVTTLSVGKRPRGVQRSPDGRRVYVAAGEGFVNVYRQVDADHYEAVGKVGTGNRGKIGLLVPELHRYYVVTSKKDSTPARSLSF